MTDPRTQLVATAYDAIADRFMEWQDLIDDDSRPRWREQLVSRLPEGARILEFGCGSGLRDTRVLAERFTVTGVDISAEQVARARSNVRGASFIHADLTEVAFAPDSFDAVASFFVLNHVPRDLLAGMFGRIHGWLRPGGLLLVTLGASDTPDWMGKWLGATMFFSGFAPEVNRQLLTDAGFALELDEVEPLREPEGDVNFHWILARRWAPRFDIEGDGATTGVRHRLLSRADLCRSRANHPTALNDNCTDVQDFLCETRQHDDKRCQTPFAVKGKRVPIVCRFLPTPTSLAFRDFRSNWRDA